MMIHKGRYWLLMAITLFTIVGGVFFHAYSNRQNSTLGKSDFLEAKKEIEKRGVNDELKTSFPKLVDFEKLGSSDFREISSTIIGEGELNENALRSLLEVIDQALISTDTDVVKYALKLLYKLYPYIENIKYMVGNDQPRKDIIIERLYSENEVVRRKAFSVLSMYFFDKKYVIPSLLEVAANSAVADKFEKLHQIRTLGTKLNNEQTSIRDYLIEEVLTGKDSLDNRATTIESVYFLSRLKPPPEEIILPTIEMLEGPSFGDPLLLDAIDNFGISVKPYIERLKALQLEVDARILHGRDNQGKGSSTFTKSRYKDVLDKIERL